MIYIFEGIDGVGKTTLVEKIYNKIGPDKIEKMKLVKPHSRDQILKFYDYINRWFCQENSKDLILDRCYLISNPIYQSIFEDNLFVKWIESKEWLTNIKEYVIIIYCYPSTERINDVKNNIDDPGIMLFFEKILNMYDDYMDELEDLGFNVIWIDPVKEEFDLNECN